MKETWIDFKALRGKLDFEKVLRYYGVEVKATGKQHHGYCPLPNHNGRKNSPSFSANLERGIFQCFGCGAKGNVLEFAVLMEKANPGDGAALRQVALKLRQQFCPDVRPNPDTPKKAIENKAESPETKRTRPVIINPALDFELKDLDPKHPYALSRGFAPETIAFFGLGFCSKGMLRDRLAIPLHDQQGRLIGYAGRLIDEGKVSEENPRYRFPGRREREGKVFEFRKTRFLYNGFRMKRPLDTLIIVEGFTSVWWLHQNGFPHAVATMGADCSEKQAELIVSLVKPAGHVWIMPDGDTAGERLAQSLLTQISPCRFVRWLRLAEGRQPTDLSTDELRQFLQD